MRNYKLFLDESGKFVEGHGKGEVSIVAGFLVENKKCDTVWANNLLNKLKQSQSAFDNVSVSPFHAMEDKSAGIPEFVTCLMEKLCKDDMRIVKFLNVKGLNVVNSDITYLNVFAEGIVELIRQLLAESEDEIHLDVLYAHRIQVKRKDETGEKIRIQLEEYRDRIDERITLHLARLPQNIRRRCHYTLATDNAKKNTLLMLADAICFALRGGKRNLNSKQINRIDALPTLHYEVVKNGIWEKIKNYFIEDRLADAIFSWYSDNDLNLEVYREEFESLLIDKLNSIGTKGIKIQYEMVSQFMGSLIDLRHFALANQFMDALIDKLFPLLLKNGLENQMFFFDVRFYRLTTATHQGDTLAAERQITICREQLKKLKPTCETLDYYLRYKLREVEHQKNIFDFEGAICTLDKLENVLNNMVALFQVVDELGDLGEGITSSTLGKVLGSKVQTRCYLLARQPEQLVLARKDSDQSIAQFTENMDRERQYQYRAMLEYEAGEYKTSLSWLSKAFKLSDDSRAEVVLKSILLQKNGVNIFGLLHYVSLMAKCFIDGDALETELYTAWIQQNAEGTLGDTIEYPVSNIYWRIGTCKAKLHAKNANDYYEKAIKYALSDINNFTNYATGLAMEAERIALLSNCKIKPFLQKLYYDYERLEKLELPRAMKAVFADWREILEKSKNVSEVLQKETMERLARNVPIL